MVPGVYTIVKRGPRNTNLVFKLELPTKESEARKELSIPEEGSYGLSLKVSLQLNAWTMSVLPASMRRTAPVVLNFDLPESEAETMSAD